MLVFLQVAPSHYLPNNAFLHFVVCIHRTVSSFPKLDAGKFGVTLSAFQNAAVFFHNIQEVLPLTFETLNMYCDKRIVTCLLYKY